MTVLIFSFFIALTLGVFGWRLSRLWLEKRTWEKRDGNRSTRPLSIRRFDEMEAHMRASPCACGGMFVLRSEGSRNLGGQRIRVVHAECTRCEREVDFFFRMDQMLN
ncbi:MAG: hypothetical protein VYA34_08990 [Myxococcota bacterium]|nr:hypothetical protein [Myxococcota bacterium]